jgi:hypothetical protein
MSEHAPRLPLSLDPLIAEAKRRARQRRMLVVAAVVLVLALVGGGATLAFRPFGLDRTSQSTRTRFVPGSLATSVPGPILDFTRAGVSALSASSRSDAWIVGSVAWHWDGHTWRTVPLPKGKSDLWSVAAVSPDDAWVVGARGNGTLARSHALIEHWNGVRWTVAWLPHLGRSFLFGVSAAGPRSVWAVGATYRLNRKGTFISSWTRPLLLHWDGASWRKQPLPWGRHALTLDKVVATGPSSVWVISTGQQEPSRSPSLIEHWNGTRWRSVPLPFGRSDPPVGFGATGLNDAWAVGSYAQGGSPAAKYSHSLAAHWNGRSWRLTHVPIRSGDNNSVLTDVAAAGPDDVWALGQSQHLHLLGDNGLSARNTGVFLDHWNGQDWRLATGAAPAIIDGQPALTATRDGAAWAMGTCFADNFILRWTNGTWVFAKHPPDRHWRKGMAPSRRPRSTPSCPSSPS